MKKTITAYVLASQQQWQTKPDLCVLSFDGSKDGSYILVDTVEIEVNVPDDFSMESFQVRKLQKQKEIETEKFNARMAQINEELSKFQCLEMSK